MKRIAPVALALLGISIVGCSAGTETAAPVSAADLTKNITDTLTKVGKPPQSVSCSGDLPGEVGKSTSCDITLTPDNRFQAIVSVARIEAGRPVPVFSPAASKDQLAQLVSRLTGASAVSCESGIEGKVGQDAQCDLNRNGVSLKQTVEVTKVEGLEMSLAVLPSLAKQQVQQLVADKLAVGAPARPQSVDCAGDLQGKPGATLECSVVTDGAAQPYVLAVTGVQGDAINFEVAPKP